jgi:predicted nucleic acid-binding protein
VAWLWLILLACAVAVLVAAEWPRLSARLGPERLRLRARSRRKEQLRIVRSDDEIDEFAASVERDLAQLPTTRDRDR